MALWSIPINFQAPDFTFQIDLDGLIYGFHFMYNERVDGWTMEIQQADGTPIVSGLQVVTGWKPLARFVDPRLPPGELFTMDITGQSNEPDDVNFGDTILLCYNEATGG